MKKALDSDFGAPLLLLAVAEYRRRRRRRRCPRGRSPSDTSQPREASRTHPKQRSAMLDTLIPTRFLTTLAHLLAVLMIFSSKVRAQAAAPRPRRRQAERSRRGRELRMPSGRFSRGLLAAGSVSLRLRLALPRGGVRAIPQANNIRVALPVTHNADEFNELDSEFDHRAITAAAACVAPAPPPLPPPHARRLH